MRAKKWIFVHLRNTGEYIIWQRKKVTESRLFWLAPSANNAITTLIRTAKQPLTDLNVTSIADFAKSTQLTEKASKE